MIRKLSSRRLLLGCAVALTLLVAGDSAQTQAITPDVGIDPLAILDLTIYPNVAFIIDTSGSMRAPFHVTDAGGNFPMIGGDDFSSKMYQAKRVVKQVVSANAGTANFGLLSYYLRNEQKNIVGFVGYVSDQPTAAHWTGGSGKPGIDMVADFFETSNFWQSWTTPSTTTRPYMTNTGTTASAVYGSFAAFPPTLDMGSLGDNCTTASECKWYLHSGFVRSGVRYTWTNPSSVTATSVDCSADVNRAPLRLFPDDPHTLVATKTDYARPCVQMENSAGEVTTFWYTGVRWSDPDGQCSGAAVVAGAPHCMTNSPTAVLDGLKLDLPLDGTCRNTSGVATPVGIPCGITPTGTGPATQIYNTNPAEDPNTMEGILPGANTPLGASLQWTRNNLDVVFPEKVAEQSDFVILVTDGIDSCTGGAALAVTEAGLLYGQGVTVFVVAMGMTADAVTQMNAMASAGSGGKYPPFSAQSPEELAAVLTQLISQTVDEGEFSDQQTITESVYEFARKADKNPLDPEERYDWIIPLLIQSTFEMPEYVGHLRAFVNNGGVAEQVWDAGDKLCQQVTGYEAIKPVGETSRCGNTAPHATAMGNQSFTFDAITGTAVVWPDTPNGRLKRRIFTSSGNGVFPYGSERQAVVPIWPPTRDGSDISHPGVDPDYNAGEYLIGSLDRGFGIAAMNLTTLKDVFGACVNSANAGILPDHCKTSASASLQLGKARKEAREMILAYAAGAVVNGRDSDPASTTYGELLYKAKKWILGDGTLSSAAVVTVPMNNRPMSVAPTIYAAEYDLYVNGTGSATDMGLGLGLRSPDEDVDDPLKPVMSVVYYGANDILHAFRAGPDGSTTGGETGGEELWGFVPYDQLGKLRLLLLEGQSRAAHKYMIATGIRFGDVFVPGEYADPKGETRAGKWRRLLYFGRGLGGKHYTALDVTSPGPFTMKALETRPPLPLWNRGNPDTEGGNPWDTANSALSGYTDRGAPDSTAYATMGQTWSVPALTRVPIEEGEPAVSLNYGMHFMLYVGSGYGAAAEEGHRLYSIDPITGDIHTSTDVGSGDTTGTTNYVSNAIVANPVVFNAGQLDLMGRHPAATVGTKLYVGDLHGRLWRFSTAAADNSTTITANEMYDFGVQQPIANAVSLLNYRTSTTDPLRPHIYVATGNDRRVTTPTTPTEGFLLAGLRDEEDPAADPLATLLFSFPLLDRFRGTVQPATTLSTLDDANHEPLARVVFAATRYNPVNEDCVSTFDSRIYIVGAASGKAAFDLDQSGNVDTTGSTDLYYDITGGLVKAVQVAFGRLVVDQGLGAGETPPPPAPPQPGGDTGSGRLLYLTSYNPVGSSVCR